ncbi:MAG TPA: hypothetical protein VGR71_00225, partial [Nitrospira sp.]|nr:hypothetical protein [Nitrospira sp.]
PYNYLLNPRGPTRSMGSRVGSAVAEISSGRRVLVENRASTITNVVIMGAAGRDFHNFNVVFRNNPSY